MIFRQLQTAFYIPIFVALAVAINDIHAAPTNVKAVKRGKYLVTIAGCNDCHTPGYSMSDGKTPEKLWLTGDAFGCKRSTKTNG